MDEGSHGIIKSVEDGLGGVSTDVWYGVPQHSFGSGQPVNLDGEWEFRFTPDDSGQKEEWFQPAVAYERTLQVPGVWQAQGVGDPEWQPFSAP